MLPKYYLQAVNRRLNLPPWYRLPELNQLAKEFYLGSAEGQTFEDVEETLGSPDQAAAAIRSKYPGYEQSSLRFMPLFFGFFCLTSMFKQSRLLISVHAVQKAAEYILPGQSQLISAPAGARPQFSILTPGEMLTISAIALLINLML